MKGAPSAPQPGGGRRWRAARAAAVSPASPAWPNRHWPIDGPGITVLPDPQPAPVRSAGRPGRPAHVAIVILAVALLGGPGAMLSVGGGSVVRARAGSSSGPSGPIVLLSGPALSPATHRPPMGWDSRTSSSPTDRNSSFTEISALEFELEPSSTTVRSGEAIDGTLVVINPTQDVVQLTRCTADQIAAGLVSADAPHAALPVLVKNDCSGAAATPVEPDHPVRLPLARPFTARSPNGSAPTTYLGVLAAGRYLAVVTVPGATSTVRVEAEVTVVSPTCPGLTDHLVRQYVGLTKPQAIALAVGQGRETSVASVDGRPRPVDGAHRCTRVDLHLAGGRVLDISLG